MYTVCVTFGTGSGVLLRDTWFSLLLCGSSTYTHNMQIRGKSIQTAGRSTFSGSFMLSELKQQPAGRLEEPTDQDRGLLKHGESAGFQLNSSTWFL